METSAQAAESFPKTALPPGPSPGLADLGEMFAELREAPAVYRPSRFWEGYAELNLEQLNDAGFDEFKRTVNRNYFQFQLSLPFHPQVAAMWRWWLRDRRSAPPRARFAHGYELDHFDRVPLPKFVRRATYARYLAVLWEFVRERDELGLLDRLDEPKVGHPICIDYNGHLVSEDLCNSTLEVNAVANALPAGSLDDATIIELGPGYGRLAWAYRQAFPRVKYVLVDIPPALAVAEQYLVSTYPQAKVFGFRRFDSEQAVLDELLAADLAFLTPNQLDKLPSFKADLFVNVSSLHEMLPEQIAHYLSLVARHTSRWFYTKQWIKSINSPDGIVVRREDYPIPGDWQPLFDRTHPVQTTFFEALYRLPD